MERGILRTFKPDGTPVEVYDAEALTKAEFTAFNTYSTDEIDTGKKWIDGRTIYKRVCDLGFLPNTTSKVVAHNIINLDLMISIAGIFYHPDNGGTTTVMNPLPFVYLGTFADQVMLSTNSTDITVRTGLDRSTQSAFVVLEYVKHN